MILTRSLLCMYVIFSRFFGKLGDCRIFIYKFMMLGMSLDTFELLIHSFLAHWRDVLIPGKRSVGVVDSEFSGLLKCIYYNLLQKKSKRKNRQSLRPLIEKETKWQRPADPHNSLVQIGFGISHRIRKKLLNIKSPVDEKIFSDDIKCLLIVSRFLGWSWTYQECLCQTLWPLLSELNGASLEGLPILIKLIGDLVISVGRINGQGGPKEPSITLIRDRMFSALFSQGK